MSVTCTLDTIQESSLSLSTINSRHVRGGFVENIDLSGVGGNKSEALYVASQAVIDALTADGTSSVVSGHTNLILSKIFLKPVSDNAASVQIVYDQLAFANPSSYLITDSGWMRTYQTNYMPGTRESLKVNWTPTGAQIGMIPPIPKQNVLFTFMQPMRRITLQALIYGRPTAGVNYLGYANDDAWPTSGGSPPLPEAHWVLSDYRTDYAKYSGYFTLSASALGNVMEDWSSFGILRNAQDGRYAQIPDADWSTMIASPYSYGPQFYNGVIKVGPYPTISFESLFGF
jgi:hypothetical protein